MTRVKVEINSKKILKRSFLDRRFEKQAGEIIVKQIKADSRLGVGYDQEPFPALKDSTIDQREYISTRTAVSQFFSPEKSNATITGQLIDSIISKTKSRFKILIFPKGNHNPYTSGSRAVKNETIMEGIQSKGWKIMGLSERSKKQVVTLYKRMLRRKLK